MSGSRRPTRSGCVTGRRYSYGLCRKPRVIESLRRARLGVERGVVENDPEGAAKRFERAGRGISLASLDPADLALRDFGRFSKLLLGQASSQPPLEKPGADGEPASGGSKRSPLLRGTRALDALNELRELCRHRTAPRLKGDMGYTTYPSVRPERPEAVPHPG